MKKRITIENMRAIAERLGGECLSKVYANARTKLRWRCNECGHEWDAVPDSVKRGTWCPKCAPKKRGKSQRLTIEEMQAIAREKGGECLSKEYVSVKTKLRWRCNNCGHEWEATPGNVKTGTWCPKCGGSFPLTIEEMRTIARERGGECLSTEYVNSQTKLRWRCENKHEWEATPGSVRSGKWCARCADRVRLTIEEMQAIAAEHGGKCLSTEYKGAHSNLLWRCENKHEWEATPASIKNQGSWCRQCAGKAPLSLEEMRSIAKERGGECLSKEYVNLKTKLRWRCAYGHEWNATPGNVKRGKWCKECSTGIGERICRAFFEQLFCGQFPSKRPKWLIGEMGVPLELDGYNAKLKLAFEHQGIHHFEAFDYVSKGGAKAEERHAAVRRRDELKREACLNYGVTLIEVPEINKNLDVVDLRNFIRRQCEIRGYPIPANFESVEVDLRAAYMANPQVQYLKEMRAIAKKRGGECLSTVYKGSQSKLRWRCNKCDYEWMATPGHVKNAGRWCPRCAKNITSTIEEMREIAKEKGGECLSTEYINSFSKLRWRCGVCSHEWEAMPTNIKSGTWCPKCAKRPQLTIEDMQALAKEKGGECLSTKYINARTKLRWRCNECGHEWEATPESARNNGTWCKACCHNVENEG